MAAYAQPRSYKAAREPVGCLHASAKHPNSKLIHLCTNCHSQTAFQPALAVRMALPWSSQLDTSLGSTLAPCFLVGSLPHCWLIPGSLTPWLIAGYLGTLLVPRFLVSSPAHCQLTGCLTHFWLSGLSAAGTLLTPWLIVGFLSSLLTPWLLVGSLAHCQLMGCLHGSLLGL